MTAAWLECSWASVMVVGNCFSRAGESAWFCLRFCSQEMTAEWVPSSGSRLSDAPWRFPSISTPSTLIFCLLYHSFSLLPIWCWQIKSTLVKFTIAGNPELDWFRMPGWHSLLYLYHAIIPVYLLGNCALWFLCWKRENSKNNNLLNSVYSIGNREIWVGARSFGGYNNHL